MPRQVLVKLDNFSDGIAYTDFSGGKNQFATTTREIDYSTQPGIIQPTIKMANNSSGLTSTPVNRVARAVIRASNGTYYWVGTNASSEMQVWTGSPEGTASTSLTTSGAGVASPTNMAEGSKLVEFDDFLFFYDTTTDLAKFNIGTPAITTNAPSGALTDNIGTDLLTYKSFLFYCNKASVGRATSNTTYNSSALVLETRYRVVTLTGWQNYIIIGARTQNEGDNSRFFLWDGVSSTYDHAVNLPAQGLSAAINNNGTIYFFCVNNINGGNRDGNRVKVFRWAGGSQVQLVRNIDLGGTSTNLFTLPPAALDIFNNKVYFTVNAGTADTMGIANGIYSIDPKGALNLDYVDGATATPDTSNLSCFFLKFINNQPLWFFSDGTNDRRENFSGLTYSSDARLDTTALQFDPRYETRIDEIFFRLVSLPASTSVAVSIATDQATFAAVKTISSGTTGLIINQNDYAFQPGHTHQLRFAFTSSSGSRARLILPIYIKATVFDGQTLTS